MKKMLERKMETEQGYGLGIGGCKRLCPTVTTRVFGGAKNTNFLKIFLQYVKHVDARSN